MPTDAKPLGQCEKCGDIVYIGEPFDLELHTWGADFPSDKPGSRKVVWHRRCNPNADHSKDGE